jgi:hypothetical protein
MKDKDGDEEGEIKNVIYIFNDVTWFELQTAFLERKNINLRGLSKNLSHMLSPLEEKLSLFSQGLRYSTNIRLNPKDDFLFHTNYETKEFNKDLIHIFSKKDIAESIIFNKYIEIANPNDYEYQDLKELVGNKPMSVIYSINKLAEQKLKLKRLNKDK